MFGGSEKITKKNKFSNTPQIKPIPKKNSVLKSSISIFASLSALSALTGSVVNVLKVINDMRSDKNSPVHLGKEMYLKPYKDASYKI